jgi:small subunit ribosomal protein S5
LLNKENDPESLELEERLIGINRVMRVRKGGRTPSFNALTAVGNREGLVGIGFASAKDVPSAIRKSMVDAKKNLVRIPLVDGTIPHQIVGYFKASKVVLRPARPGTGIVAGLATRVILEFAGVRNVLTKRIGSRNMKNTAEATMQGLKSLKRIEEVARLRGKTVEEIRG